MFTFCFRIILLKNVIECDSYSIIEATQVPATANNKQKLQQNQKVLNDGNKTNKTISSQPRKTNKQTNKGEKRITTQPRKIDKHQLYLDDALFQVDLL